MQCISPFFRSPFTDLTGGMFSHQLMGRCNLEEMDLMDCLEANGLDRGIRKCADFLEDFKECHTRTKSRKRVDAIRTERERKIATGQLKGDKKFVTPRIDSY